MLIYRVQAPDGTGAYYVDADLCYAGRKNSPGPWDDVGLDWCNRSSWAKDWKDRLFAFESLDAFRKWFNGYEIEELTKHCRLYLISAPRVQFGSYQCVFDPESAVHLADYDLFEIYNDRSR